MHIENQIVLRSIIPLYMVICFTQIIPPMLTVIVDEKEKKIKESMKMVGLRDSVFWLSWFLVYTVMATFVALLAAIVTKFVIVKASDFGLVFLVMEIFALSLIMMAFMFTAIFSKAKVKDLHLYFNITDLSCLALDGGWLWRSHHAAHVAGLLLSSLPQRFSRIRLLADILAQPIRLRYGIR